jgi:hypothetical protein
MKLQKLAHILILIIAIGLLPNAYAVSPPPDGCYPGYTTAEGCNTLQGLTTGLGNTGVGWYSLFSDTTSSFNTGIGAGALALNDQDSDSNTAIGAGALLLNTHGMRNTAIGTDALLYNFDGVFNDAVGAFALFNNNDGFSNNAMGDSALFDNISGVQNTAIGDLALAFNDLTGAGKANYNTAVGAEALYNNIDGDSNNAIGVQALSSNTGGFFNQAMGFQALGSNMDGSVNVAIGDSALASNVHGTFNTVIGWDAGLTAEGDDNIYIGATSADGVASESGTIRIGDPNYVVACYIAGIVGQTATSGSPVFIDANGQLGTLTSSARFKDDIKTMGEASESIFALKPVTFRYKKEIDGLGAAQFGLVAEDVEKVNPDLVVRDKEGKPYSVRYDQVNAMLLNEFLKEHRRVEGQQAEIDHQDMTISQLKSTAAQKQKRFESKLAQQEQQIAALAADLQRLAADVKLNKAEPRTIAQK